MLLLLKKAIARAVLTSTVAATSVAPNTAATANNVPLMDNYGVLSMIVGSEVTPYQETEIESVTVVEEDIVELIAENNVTVVTEGTEPLPEALRNVLEMNRSIVAWTAGGELREYTLTDTALIELRDQYPTGSWWDSECYYKWNAASVYRGGYGCAGFAYMLSDAIYGAARARKIESNSDVEPYDCIELFNNAHTAFVLEVPGDGTVIVAEGNVDGRVYWGSTYSISDVSAVLKR